MLSLLIMVLWIVSKGPLFTLYSQISQGDTTTVLHTQDLTTVQSEKLERSSNHKYRNSSKCGEQKLPFCGRHIGKYKQSKQSAGNSHRMTPFMLMGDFSISAPVYLKFNSKN